MHSILGLAAALGTDRPAATTTATASARAGVRGHLVRRLTATLVAALCLIAVAAQAAPAFTAQLKRYPYLTDAVAGGVTVSWATDQSLAAGFLAWGQVGVESCTAHTAAATRTTVNVNGVLEYQWTARLTQSPDTRFCYRVFGNTSASSTPVVDLLATDASPQAATQLPAGSTAPYTFAVFGDWGQGLAAGNPDQAGVMREIAASGARFAIATGDTGYPSGNQANYGDLVQTGADISGVFGPDGWTIAGDSVPLFSPAGNHGFNSTYPAMWPSSNAAAASGGVFGMQSYCCTNGTTMADYPDAWYAFDQGNARFYILEAAWSDTNVGTADPYKNDYDNHWTPSSPEYQWLQNDLATHPSQVKFAVWHYPLYSDTSGEPSDTFLQGASSLEGLLGSYGVDIGFNGHAHVYQRNAAAPGGLVTYITGGGGAALLPVDSCSAIDAYAIGWANSTAKGSACGAATPPASKAQVFHFLLVTVNGTRVTVTPTDSTGQAFDVQTYDFPNEPGAPPAVTPPATPPAVPDAQPATSAAPSPGARISRQPRPAVTKTALAAAFRRVPVRKRSGRRPATKASRTVDGRLTTSAGQPLAGESVEMEARPRTSASRWKTVATARTTQQGRVSFTAARSPSLYVRLVFARTSTLTAARSRHLETHVAERSSIAVSARTRSNGEAIRFHGRLRGGYVAKHGRVVELQRFDAGLKRWVQVRGGLLRSDRRGRWHASYSVTTARGGTVARFRARIPARPDSPFDEGFSRTVRVRVTGG